MEIRKVKLSELKDSKYNPRKISKEELQRLEDSMDKFGYVEPIVWNEKTGNIVGGHQRLKILSKKLTSEDTIEVVVVNLDEYQEKALNLALNKITGEWDEDKLSELLALIKQQDEDLLKFTGFSEQEYSKLIGQIGQEDNFEIPKEPKYKIERGEIWQLGNHRLMCGDATNEGEVNKLIGDIKIKTIFTSPPYNMNSNLYKNYKDNLKSEDYIKLNLQTIKIWQQHLDGFLFWNLSYNKNQRWEFLDIMAQICKIEKLRFLELICWNKGTALPINSKEQITRSYEDILFMSTEEAYIDIEWIEVLTTERKAIFNKERGIGISNYWYIPVTKTQTEDLRACFPIRLPVKAIFLTTKQGEIMADCFGGSGSTLIACEQTKRICYMMEIDPFYCSVIIERWEAFTGGKAIKL